MEEKALLASSNLTPVLAIGSEAGTFAMSQNFPEKDEKVPLLAAQVAWSEILLAGSCSSSSPRQDGTVTASSGVMLRAHVILLNKKQLSKHLRRNNGKILVLVPGEHVKFRSGARFSSRREVIWFVHKGSSTHN